jgi:hypothetical protein
MIKTATIHITPELLALISEVDEFKGAWRALGTLAPERLKALRPKPMYTTSPGSCQEMA